MQFIDEATVHVRGGNGGAGSVHWRREKFAPKGGPDGGDGGNGGAVIFIADSNLNTLVDHAANPHIFAEDGDPGAENQKTGAGGSNKIIKVPLGTEIFFEEKSIADLSKEGAKWIAARGGHGGKGNTHFKTASNQAPDYAQPGVKGEERTFKLVLKSIADVGLVGLPNAGKSTLVKSVSGAKPKVADYPFTTLTPELGVVMLSAGRRFVLADIPGIIEGAHTGKGLGLEFLKHIERTKVLVYVIDITQTATYKSLISEDVDQDKLDSILTKISEESLAQLKLLKEEIASYSEKLFQKPHLVIFSKADLNYVKEVFGKVNSAELNSTNISSSSSFNLDTVCERMWNELLELQKATSLGNCNG